MYTGWRPVVAAYQWWPFAVCTGNYVFVASQNWQHCKSKQKESQLKRLVKFSVCKAKKETISRSNSHANIATFPGDYSTSDIYN